MSANSHTSLTYYFKIKFKHMKNIYPLLAIVVAVSFLTTTYAQADLKGHSGLYMTSNDYIALKLNLEVDCTKESQKITVKNEDGSF